MGCWLLQFFSPQKCSGRCDKIIFRSGWDWENLEIEEAHTWAMDAVLEEEGFLE